MGHRVCGHRRPFGRNCRQRLRRSLLSGRSIGTRDPPCSVRSPARCCAFSPPLVMSLDEARDYLDAMFHLFRLSAKTAGGRAAIMTHEELMRLAIDQALEGIAAGQSPFGCAIAIGDRVLAAAHNRVWAECDITAHAEIVALRTACGAAGRPLLADAIVATTCEPCPMCMSALHWARVDTVYFGASIPDATAAGFNELNIPAADIVRLGGSGVRLVSDLLGDECRELFHRWRAAADARTY